MPTPKEIQEALGRAGVPETAKRLQQAIESHPALSRPSPAFDFSAMSSLALHEPGGEAGMVYSRIKEAYADALEDLREDENMLITFHPQAGETIAISDLGYHGPNLLYIYGKDQHERECIALTHPYTVQVIMRIAKREANEPERRIGFRGEVSGNSEPLQDSEE